MFEIFKKIRLKKSYFAKKSYLQGRNSNIFRRAHHKMQTLGLIFGLLFAPFVLADSLISHTSFLMVANIVFSAGSLFSILYGIYEKLYYRQYQAAFWDFLFTAAIITGLFFLVFTYAPLISGSGLIATICFINLFASSINIFMLMRSLVLPSLLFIPQYISRKFGFAANIELEFAPDFSLEEDDCAYHLVDHIYDLDMIDKDYGKSFEQATDLNISHQASSSVFSKSADCKETETLMKISAQGVVFWQQVALLPFNNSKNLLYTYINKYLLGFFGAIERSGDIEKRQANYDDMVQKFSISGSHDTFFKKKILQKSKKIQLLTKAYNKCKELESNSDDHQSKKDTLLAYFEKSSVKEGIPLQDYVDVLKGEIERQAEKIVILLNCFPIHLVLRTLQTNTQNSLSEQQRKYFCRKRFKQTDICIYNENFKKEHKDFIEYEEDPAYLFTPTSD